MKVWMLAEAFRINGDGDCPVRPTTRPCMTQAEAAAAWNQRAPGTPSRADGTGAKPGGGRKKTKRWPWTTR